MIYKLLADAVVLIHFLWIIFLILGAFMGVKKRAIKVFHLSALLFAFGLQLLDWYCPLTHLEVWLKAKHDPALAYRGSFIIHYLEKIVYIQVSRKLILIATVLLCAFNFGVYLRKRDRPEPFGKNPPCPGAL